MHSPTTGISDLLNVQDGVLRTNYPTIWRKVTQFLLAPFDDYHCNLVLISFTCRNNALAAGF